MSVRYDPPGAPDYYPGFSTAAIRRSSISRNKFLPGTHFDWLLSNNTMVVTINCTVTINDKFHATNCCAAHLYFGKTDSISF